MKMEQNNRAALAYTQLKNEEKTRQAAAAASYNS